MTSDAVVPLPSATDRVIELVDRAAWLRAAAGNPTLNWLEHTPTGAHRNRRIGHEPEAIETQFVDLFLDGHAQVSAHLILDLDGTEEPFHGRQEGRSPTATTTATAIPRSSPSQATNCWSRSSGRPAATPGRVG